MADRPTREDRKADKEQESFFKALDKMDENQYQSFAKAFASNPEAAMALAFPKARSLPENAVDMAREYIKTDARNERQYQGALADIAKDAKPLADVLAACNDRKLDPDVCEAAHDVLGKLNKIVTPTPAGKGYDGEQKNR